MIFNKYSITTMTLLSFIRRFKSQSENGDTTRVFIKVHACEFVLIITLNV